MTALRGRGKVNFELSWVFAKSLWSQGLMLQGRGDIMNTQLVLLVLQD